MPWRIVRLQPRAWIGPALKPLNFTRWLQKSPLYVLLCKDCRRGVQYLLKHVIGSQLVLQMVIGTSAVWRVPRSLASFDHLGISHTCSNIRKDSPFFRAFLSLLRTERALHAYFVLYGRRLKRTHWCLPQLLAPCQPSAPGMAHTYRMPSAMHSCPKSEVSHVICSLDVLIR